MVTMTDAQFRADPWIRAEVVPPPMMAFGRDLCAYLDVPITHFGARGDRRHDDGGHRSQAFILRSPYCGNRSYSVVPGLPASHMNLVSAFDISPKDRGQMLVISQRIDRWTRLGYLEEVVEWYGNINGDQRVDGWNNIKNAVASSDSSHLTHLHGRWDRRRLLEPGIYQRTLACLMGAQAPVIPAPPPVQVKQRKAQMITIASVKGDPKAYAGDGTYYWHLKGDGSLEALEVMTAEGAKLDFRTLAGMRHVLGSVEVADAAEARLRQAANVDVSKLAGLIVGELAEMDSIDAETVAAGVKLAFERGVTLKAAGG